MWQHRASVATEQVERLRAGYQRGACARLCWCICRCTHESRCPSAASSTSHSALPTGCLQHPALVVLPPALEADSELQHVHNCHIPSPRAVRREHAELRRKLQAGALDSPGGSSTAVATPSAGTGRQVVARTPTPLALRNGGRHGRGQMSPATPASSLPPVSSQRRCMQDNLVTA